MSLGVWGLYVVIQVHVALLRARPPSHDPPRGLRDRTPASPPPSYVPSYAVTVAPSVSSEASSFAIGAEAREYLLRHDAAEETYNTNLRARRERRVHEPLGIGRPVRLRRPVVHYITAVHVI